MKLAVALVGCIIALAVSKEVIELGESNTAKNPEPGPTGSHDGDAISDTWGRAQGPKNLNMVGPPYGNPGYKESHQWESDVDIWSPVVFNWQFYSAMYASDGLEDKSEADARKNWLEVANAEDLKYPECRQGSDQFSVNMYYRANPALASSTKGVCKAILENYLQTGIIDGKPTFSASAEQTYRDSLSEDELAEYNSSPKGKARAQTVRRGEDNQWTLNRQNGNLGEVIAAEKQYTYSFWLNVINGGENSGNILQYGNNAPKISLAANYGKYLEIISAQSNSDVWGCNTPDTEEFQIPLKTWTHVAVVVQDKQLTTYINGKKAVECTNDGGEIAILTDKTLYCPANEDYAEAKIKNLKYWGGCPLNKELVGVEHAQGPDV